MKKTVRIVFVMLFFLSAFPLCAQTVPTSTRVFVNMNSPIDFTLMRTYAHDDLFYYVRTRDSNFFALHPFGDTMAMRGYIPSRYKVSDMEVLDSYAYICGYDTQTKRGFVGIFHIKEFLLGNDTYRIYEDFQVPGQDIPLQNVKRLCVFPEKEKANIVHVVAVCSDTTQNYVLEMTGLPTSTAAWNYTVGASRTVKEVFHDVVFTDKYVVTAGNSLRNSGEVSLRAYDKYTIFSSNICETMYPFYTYGNIPSIHYAREGLHLTALGHDSVATLSATDVRRIIVEDDTLYEKGIMLNLYDIPAILSTTTPYSQYSGVHWSNDTTGTSSVTALRYDTTHRSLVGVAHLGTSTVGTGLLESWLPEFTVGGTPTYVMTKNDPIICYESVDVDQIQGNFRAIGRSSFTPTYLFLTTCAFNSIFVSSNCDSISNQPISSGYRFRAKEEYRPFTKRSGSVSCQVNYPLRIDNMKIPYSCIR